MKNVMKLTMALAMTVMVLSVSAQDAPRRPRGERPTQEQMVKEQIDRLTKELKLDSDQQKKVTDLIKKQNEERSPMSGQSNFRDLSESERQAAMEKMRAEIKKRTDDMNAEMKKILTPEQYEKYEKSVKDRQAQMQQRRPGSDTPRGPRPEGANAQ